MRTIAMAILMLIGCVVEAGEGLSGPRAQFQSPVPRYAIIYNDDRGGLGRFVTVLMDPSEFSEANVRILFQMLSRRFSAVPKYTVFIATSLQDVQTPEEHDDTEDSRKWGKILRRSEHRRLRFGTRPKLTGFICSCLLVVLRNL